MPIGTLTKRLIKGSRLTPAEGDGNLTTIENFVNGLETRLDVSINADGSVRDQKVPYATTASGTDAYAISIAGTFGAITDFAGRVILIKVDVANTGPATIAINSFSATGIKKTGGLALVSGDLKPGIAALVYDPVSASFLLLNPGSNSQVNYAAASNSGNDYTATVASLASQGFEVPETYYAGYTVLVKLSATNTGVPRLKIAVTDPAIDLGFAEVRKYSGAALVGGELVNGGIYELTYDGTYWLVANPVSAGTTLIYRSTGIAIPTSTTSKLAAALTHGLGGLPDSVQWWLVNKGNASGIAHEYAVGDRVDLRAIFYSADVYDVFIPLTTSTELDMLIENVGAILRRDTLTHATLNLTDLSQDFDLAVSATRVV